MDGDFVQKLDLDMIRDYQWVDIFVKMNAKEESIIIFVSKIVENKSYSCEILGGGWEYCSAAYQIDYRGN